ncbi:MAG: sec-independent protein translocase protein TatA [Actinomycetota bacterium]|jgi:sec-independent protein translocase protein TatA|nr:sec-independent protein translocase protein TatA [Actinomycetota bacterium]
MSGIGAPELLVLLVILLLIFGANKLPKLARSIGQAGKEFKEGVKEGAVAQPVEGPCPFCGVQVPADSKFCPGCAKSAEEIVAERAKQPKPSA